MKWERGSPLKAVGWKLDGKCILLLEYIFVLFLVKFNRQRDKRGPVAIAWKNHTLIFFSRASSFELSLYRCDPHFNRQYRAYIAYILQYIYSLSEVDVKTWFIIVCHSGVCAFIFTPVQSVDGLATSSY